MDTPDRSKIGTPVSKFEDSPVFNYISNLSPIKPVKSVHITQTFQSLSFVTSLPSVFTSPHISSHKESRFLKRHHLSDLSKPEFDDSHEGKTSLGVEDTIHLPGDSADTPERCDAVTSLEEFNVDPLNKCSKLSIKLSQTLQYDCASPKSDTTSFCGGIKTDADMEMSATPVSLIRLVQEAPEERQQHSLETEVESQERFRLEQAKEEVPGFNWEYLISDDADEVLIYDSSANQSEAFKGPDQTLAEPNANDFALHISKFPNDKTDDLHKAQSAGSHCSFYQHHKQDCAVHPEEVREQNETDHTPELLSSTFQNKRGIGDISDKTDNRLKECISLGIKIETQQQRGMRRRCLVFEMTGSKKKTSEADSKSYSSNLMQSGGTVSLDDKRLATVKSPIGSLPCMLPGIGLHLNALATASKECRMAKHETLGPGNQLISKPTTVGSLHSATTGQESSDKSLALISVERDLGSAGNEVQVMKDAFQAPSFGAVTEFNPNSPKKKRCKLENAGESESCKRCNCKKSKCLKLYCECFAAGVYCVEPCSCHDCFNKPIHEDTVLATRKQIESRNPLAFAPKVIRSSESVPDIGEEGNNTPASARHKRGCNCKKSSCLKKYCECYQGGVGCSSNCRCEGCKNAFGRKDGYIPPIIEEADLEDEESEAGNKDELDDSLQTMEVQKDERKHFDAILPMTPVQHCRPPVEQQCFSGGRPPRSSLVAIGTSHLRPCQTLRKSAFPCPQPEIEKQVQNIPEDETPDILIASSSSLNGVKSASPNRKRVSPPHNQLGSSPGQRGAQKLILQSVPPFPSLNHHGQIFR